MKIVFTPDWFLGGDVLIEVFSFLILLAFLILAYRNYKLSKNRSTKYLGLGFLAIAIAELATVFTKFVLYYDTTFTQEIGQMIITSRVVQSVDLFYYIGFFFHKLLTLGGLYAIYRIPLKRKLERDSLLAVCFIIISAAFSSAIYYLFHLTALILLILIINNYYKVYKENKSKNTCILLSSFSLLALSQLIFILSNLDICYVLAQILQLVSYLMLLFLIIRITRGKHGRKKLRVGNKN